MKTLIDTNILVHAHDSASPYQKNASELLKSALAGAIEAVVSIQNIAELYSVLSSRKRVKRPLNPSEAQHICKLYLEAPEIPKLIPDAKALRRALELVSEHNVAGGDLFDCLLAATMECSEVKRIYTENVSDFERFTNVESIFPFRGKAKHTLRNEQQKE